MFELTEKVCNTCKVLLSIGSYHNSSKSLDGHVHRCKSCCRLRSQNIRKASSPEKLAADYALAKKWTQANKDKIRDQSKRYAVKHAEKLKVKSELYRNKNREAWNARARKYREDHLEECLERTRNYAKNNPEKLKAYRMANRARFKVTLQNRRARLKGAGGKLTQEDLDRKLILQKGKCYYCHKKMGSDKTIEHIVPIFHGGSNEFNNIVLACNHCNCTKQRRLPHEWPQGGRLL